MLQGIEWCDTAFRIVVQHAQDQVWKRRNIEVVFIYCRSAQCAVVLIANVSEFLEMTHTKTTDTTFRCNFNVLPLNFR